MTILNARPERRNQTESTTPNLEAGSVPHWHELPLRIRQRLALEDIRSLEDWRRLGEKRQWLFGITPHDVELLESLAHGAP
jgi:hypothetical protein